MKRANSELGRLGGEAGTPARGYRRLREDPYTAMQRIAGEIGPRAATSVAEAKAAAYLDGRLRRAGLLLSADTFRLGGGQGWEGLLLGALMLVVAVLWFWQPLPSVLLALWSVCVAGYLARPGRAPLLGSRRRSQNVVATRAAASRARWRVVLLAPLDSLPVLGRLDRALLQPQRLRLGRVLASLLLAGLGLLGLLGPLGLPAEVLRVAGYAQFVPVAYVLITGALEMLAARRVYSPGAASHAGALAAMLAATEMTESLQRVELWAVGLGATSLGMGLADLLRRYPFDPEATLFVCLEGIGVGSLCFVADGDAARGLPADPTLLSMAHAVGVEAQSEAGPRTYHGGRTQAGLMRTAGLRTLAIMCLDAEGRVPRQSSADDTVECVDAALLEQAAQLVAGIVRRLDVNGA